MAGFGKSGSFFVPRLKSNLSKRGFFYLSIKKEKYLSAKFFMRAHNSKVMKFKGEPMKRYFLTFVTLFSLIYNQAGWAVNFQQAVRPLAEMVLTYNSMRTDPLSFTKSMDSRDSRVYRDILKKGNVSQLPEITRIQEGVYQLIVGEDRVIFDEKNWNNRIIIVNAFAIALSKIKNLNQLMETLGKVLSGKEKTTSIFEQIRDFFFTPVMAGITSSTPSSTSWLTPGKAIIGAGLLAALGIGFLVYKNKDNDKKSSSTSNAKSTLGSTSIGGGVAGKTLSVSEVGASQDHGFFAIEEFNGALFAGSFGYAKRQMIYKVEPFGPVSPGFTVRESVCALKSFNGSLIANTESDGLIYKSTDGSNWQKVHDGGGPVGCALAVHKDYIYAASANPNESNKPSYIYRSKDGSSWEKVYDGGKKVEYIRELVSYGDNVYAFYVTDQNNTFMLKSADGQKWDKSSTPARMFRGRVHKGLLYLTSAGAHSGGASGIWKYDGSSFTQVHAVPGKSHVSNIIGAGNDLIAITTKQWKGHGGGASILVSCGGDSNWTEKKVFNETESWGLAVKDGSVYVGTKEDGGGGKLYKFQGICSGASVTETASSSGTADPDAKACNQVEGFVWKMNKQGNLAVVMNKADQGCKAIVNGRNPDECKKLDNGDNRPFCRHYQSPGSFQSPATVEVNCNGSVKYKVNIPATGQRCAFYPGGWGD